MKISVDFRALEEERQRKATDREALEIRIAAMAREGLPAPTIALRIGISTSTIRRVLRQLRDSLEA
jgi:DNA-binding NarL/FixJ family response regulator